MNNITTYTDVLLSSQFQLQVSCAQNIHNLLQYLLNNSQLFVHRGSA